MRYIFNWNDPRKMSKETLLKDYLDAISNKNTLQIACKWCGGYHSSYEEGYYCTRKHLGCAMPEKKSGNA